MTDNVNHPPHYNAGKIEVIEFIEDQKLNYHLGNCVKYIARAGKKQNELEDLKKARWYLERRIEQMEALIEGRDPVRPNDMFLNSKEHTTSFTATLVSKDQEKINQMISGFAEELLHKRDKILEDFCKAYLASTIEVPTDLKVLTPAQFLIGMIKDVELVQQNHGDGTTTFWFQKRD